MFHDLRRSLILQYSFFISSERIFKICCDNCRNLKPYGFKEVLKMKSKENKFWENLSRWYYLELVYKL